VQTNRLRLLTLFKEVAHLIEANEETILGILNTVETYKTAQIELVKSVRALRTYDRELQFIEGRKPLGTVAVFLPFNTPLYSLILYSFGPLLAGNDVIVRPSGLTAHAVQNIWETLLPGLRDLNVQLVVKSSKEFLATVLSHQPVEAIIFAGTWTNVQRLASMVPPNVKLIYCGGGLNPFVVLESANLEDAVDSAIYSRTFNSGQDCLAAERFYISSKVAKKFYEILVDGVSELRVGELSDRDVDVGPVISKEFTDNVTKLLAKPFRDNKIIYGRNPMNGIVYPTLVAAKDDDPIVRSEKYAVIFPLVEFDTNQELHGYIDDKNYCLGATVFGDVEEISGLQIRAPHLAVNDCLLHIEEADAHLPFGGFDRSGFVSDCGVIRGGPILFSEETSEGNDNTSGQ
jgi:acyl-CoA reductase-like NAD-dependent aldehyde dehydrogenase